jgi:methylmalonyl-CoA/ethylmalonyl-CoA epimerase
MSTLTIHHIGYLVKKIVPAIRSFEALGFQVAREVTRDDIREVDICFLEKNGYRVELVSPYSATSVVAGLLKKYKNCPYHICYETSHFEEALEELTSHGYVMMGSPTPAPAIDQHPVVFLMNASLGMIELLDLG